MSGNGAIDVNIGALEDDSAPVDETKALYGRCCNRVRLPYQLGIPSVALTPVTERVAMAAVMFSFYHQWTEVCSLAN